MPEALVAPVASLAVILVVAGVAKLWRPRTAVTALRLAGGRGSDEAVRALGLFEIIVGVWWITSSAPLAAIAMAVLFSTFALFTVYVLAAEVPLSSCGCLGVEDAPPTKIHVIVNSLAASLAAMAAVVGVPGFAMTLAAAPPAQSALTLALVVVAVYLWFSAFTYLPRALASVSEFDERSPV